MPDIKTPLGVTIHKLRITDIKAAKSWQMSLQSNRSRWFVVEKCWTQPLWTPLSWNLRSSVPGDICQPDRLELGQKGQRNTLLSGLFHRDDVWGQWEVLGWVTEPTQQDPGAKRRIDVDAGVHPFPSMARVPASAWKWLWRGLFLQSGAIFHLPYSWKWPLLISTLCSTCGVQITLLPSLPGPWESASQGRLFPTRASRWELAGLLLASLLSGPLPNQALVNTSALYQTSRNLKDSNYC